MLIDIVYHSAKLIQQIPNLNFIIKLKPLQISCKDKELLRNVAFMMLCLSNIYCTSIIFSPKAAYADFRTGSLMLILEPKNEPTLGVELTSSRLRLIAQDNVSTIDNNAANQTKIGLNNTLPDQYIITLKDEVNRSPKSLQVVLDNLTAKVQNDGAKVLYVYKYSIKGLAIKVPNQQVLEKLLIDLKKDSRIASIEPDKTMRAF
jgi:hypothetical protein